MANIGELHVGQLVAHKTMQVGQYMNVGYIVGFTLNDSLTPELIPIVKWAKRFGWMSDECFERGSIHPFNLVVIQTPVKNIYWDADKEAFVLFT